MIMNWKIIIEIFFPSNFYLFFSILVYNIVYHNLIQIIQCIVYNKIYIILSNNVIK